MLPAVKIAVIEDGEPVGHLTTYVLGSLPDVADAVSAEIAGLLTADRTFTVEAVRLAEVDRARLP